VEAVGQSTAADEATKKYKMSWSQQTLKIEWQQKQWPRGQIFHVQTQTELEQLVQEERKKVKVEAGEVYGQTQKVCRMSYVICRMSYMSYT
jgi:hypothetical protein